MSDEPLASFVAAIGATLREMAGVEAALREAGPAAAGAGMAEVSTGLRLIADHEGWLILNYPMPTARALAGRILAESGREPDQDLIQDCMGELVNVIAGQAKTLLFGTPYHFTLTTPTRMTGTLEDRHRGAWMLRFTTDVGDMIVYLLPPRAKDVFNAPG